MSRAREANHPTGICLGPCCDAKRAEVQRQYGVVPLLADQKRRAKAVGQDLAFTPGAVLAQGAIEWPKGITRPERAWWQKLEVDRMLGEVLWFRFHGVTLFLGDDCRYTPDFVVLPKDGILRCDEVKGPYIRKGDDGMVKLRTAASLFPFRFQRHQLQRDGSWTRLDIPKGA